MRLIHVDYHKRFQSASSMISIKPHFSSISSSFYNQIARYSRNSRDQLCKCSNPGPRKGFSRFDHLFQDTSLATKNPRKRAQWTPQIRIGISFLDNIEFMFSIQNVLEWTGDGLNLFKATSKFWENTNGQVKWFKNIKKKFTKHKMLGIRKEHILCLQRRVGWDFEKPQDHGS